MKRFLVRALAIGAALVFVLVPTPASGQTATLAVSATVATACQIVALPLAFLYDPADGADTTATTTITVTCASPHEIAIDACTNGGGTTSSRQMEDPVSLAKLSYTLNCATEGDAECSSNWGENQGVDTLTGTSILAQAYTVDGTISAGQSVPTGEFLDSCTVSLQF